MQTLQSSDQSNRQAVEYHLLKETELWRLRDDDPRAREELVSRYLPFARRLAKKHGNRWESADDLTQVASLGLVNAVNRFDPSKGTPFAAFASPTINGELKRYFRDRVWMIRVPRDLQEEILEVEHAIDDLSAELHRAPTPEEIDQRTRRGDGSALRATAAKSERLPSSLDTPTEDGQTEMDRFGVEDRHFAAIEESDALRQAMADLDPVTGQILRLRFVEDMTQSEIAERIGCSQMHVSRVLKRSITMILEKISTA